MSWKKYSDHRNKKRRDRRKADRDIAKKGEFAKRQIVKFATKLRESGASPQTILKYLMNEGQLSYEQAMEVISEIEK